MFLPPRKGEDSTADASSERNEFPSPPPIPQSHTAQNSKSPPREGGTHICTVPTTARALCVTMSMQDGCFFADEASEVWEFSSFTKAIQPVSIRTGIGT